ncbi:MAG: ABC transporter ATP-binding protein, partial [Erysipelotrichaceae bacterium]|nr:ABC transporter ATP-binding protein [Erysipelotrichaceae bacterium]
MIELRNISKNYAVADSEVAALKNVSLAFRPNEFVAILGPSGGGKTTMLNIVGGLDHCSSGDLLINGRSTADFRDGDWDAYRNHAVGFIFQSYNLIPHQSVISNVELALTISGISAAQRRQKAQEALLAVGLQDQMYKKPNQLSGGQMQRVAIARALVNDPQIVLADEPTGALDTQSSLQVMDILKKVAKDRLVVMVTHNPELAEKYANRIITIRDGQITGDSNPYREMAEEDGNAEIGRASMNLLTAFSLSLNNLMTKFGRTLLVSLAGSIGIIGIALIMALSNGVNRYIDEVQKNSLSSYPLTIENSDVDMTSAMMNMMGTAAKAVSEDGRIVEVPIIADMFNQIGANNLSLLKQHIERNWDTVGPLLSTMKYRYNINPQIYSADISEKVIKLSPASLFGRTGSSAMMSSSYSGRDIFQEMVDNQQLLEEQYEVLAGHWPQKFDELVLIIYDANTISDYLVYSLGLRDPEELRDYFSKVMNGEPVNVDNVPMSFKPEDLLGMEFRLVLAADYYRYDEAHDIWEDMTSDEEYMKQLVSDGVKLKITGIVIPREGVSGTVMTPGVGYTSALMEYIVRESASKQVVIQQLEDRNRDVFSRRSFEDINKKVETEIDFSDMFTFDENRFASAFSMNIDTNALSSSLAGIMNTSMNRLVSDLAGVTSDV